MCFNPLSIEFNISKIQKYTVRFVSTVLATMLYSAINILIFYGIKTSNLGIGVIFETIIAFILSFCLYLIVSSSVLLLAIIIVMDNTDCIEKKDDENVKER